MAKITPIPTEERDYSSNPAYHLGFATSYVKLFIPSTHYAFEDIRGEAILGLVEAAERYDPTISKFATYAKSFILRRIYSGLKGLISFSGLESRNHRKYYGNHSEIPMDATTHDISDILKIPLGELITILNANIPPLSLDKPIGEDETRNMHDIIPSQANDPYTLLTEGIDDSVRYKNRVRTAMEEARITGRRRDIIEKRLGLNGEEGITLEELGERHDVTRERIRQLQEEAIKIIQQYL